MPTEEQFVSHIDFGDGVVRTIKDPNASGTAVVGVKGDAEESYRHGNVNITKGNIGLGNVENAKQVSAEENQGLTDTEKGYARDNIGLGSAATKNTPASGDASSAEVVLGNDSRLTDAREASDVYSWAKASTKPSYTAAEVGAVDVAMVGVAGGIAELDSLGKVPASQLPSYVDDVLEYADLSSFPATGESGKIYVAQDTNKTYRWSGSGYVVISETLALGETESTAYRGDRGKTAYDHSQSTHARTDATKTEASSTNGNIKINGTETTVYTHPGSGTNPHGTTKSDVGLGNVGNFKAVSTVASQGLSDTEKSNARTNIGAGTSSLTIGTTASTAAAGNHTHTTSLATDSGTATVTLARNTTYKLTAGGTNVIFKTPASDNTNTTYTIATGDSNGQIKVTPSSGSAYNVAVKGLGTAAYTASTAYAAASHTHSYLPLAGGTMTGKQIFSTDNNVAIDFRNNDSYHTTATYLTSGNEALVFATKNAVTSFIFVNGEDSIANHASDRWQSLTPALQIKNGCVSIGKLITNGTTPTHKLEVNGNIQATSLNGVTIGSSPKFTDTNTWRPVGTGASDAAAGNHTHATSIAASSGTNQLTLAASTKYAITAGGTSYIFTTPPNTNTWRGIQDNLTSSTNTTESLSAKQGYLLANGSARDSTKAPTSHASTATTYGVGNASNYGHVKLSDTYASNVGAAANSIGASQTALYNAYAKLLGTAEVVAGNDVSPTGQYFYVKFTNKSTAMIIGYANFGNCAMTTAYGNMYYCNKTLTFPSAYISKVNAISVSGVGNGGGFFKVYTISNNVVNLFAMSPLSETQSMVCHFVAWITLK